MKLKRRLPKNRTFDQIKNHYLVESDIAKKIKNSNFEERKKIYASMYDELFKKVPDHPRLTIRDNPELTQKSNASKFAQLRGKINSNDVFVEFAPGDCKFSFVVSRHVKEVIGIDISDQKTASENIPKNFKLIIYDGYNLDSISEKSVDVAYSDQLIEHFHPEETRPHFEIVYRILKNGGRYFFRTPHAKSGPYDVSMYFSDEPTCFHLKEWTYTELYSLLSNIGFEKIKSFWFAKKIRIRLPKYYFTIFEFILSFFPNNFRRNISKLLIPCILCEAIK